MEIHPFSGISNCVLGTDVRAGSSSRLAAITSTARPFASDPLSSWRAWAVGSSARSITLTRYITCTCMQYSVGRNKKQTAARPPTRAMGQGRRPGTPSARPSRNDRQRILMPHMQSDKRLPLWLIVRWLCRCNQTACLTPRSVAGSPVGNTLTCGGCRQATEAGRTDGACMHDALTASRTQPLAFSLACTNCHLLGRAANAGRNKRYTHVKLGLDLFHVPAET